ncbi:DDE family transposase [Phaeovulum vinaykumarii]|uniref:Transposase DDE domain-containing protein n=1 Tax=Phaeovulum vinaykumarii TaxID=407234 RepID=A0A1N7JNW1_9RHOB|nr:Transposase DDE domain-containing protein [Phaeovulum vinaykumarii]SOB90532.1 DDE family transposase [Phaeovulum vinaykumarii]
MSRRERWVGQAGARGADRASTGASEPLQSVLVAGAAISVAKPTRAAVKRRYKRRNRIKIMFGRLKDWRHVPTRYDRCPKLFLSAIALAATVIYWL